MPINGNSGEMRQTKLALSALLAYSIHSAYSRAH